MANKTIHELSSIANLSSSDELAIYDVSGSVTGNGTIEGILGTDITGLDTTATNLIDAVNQHEDTLESLEQSDFLYADDGQAPSGEVEFVSQDTELTPSSSTSVTLLSGNDSWGQRFVKISKMFKNIRYLLNKIGSTIMGTEDTTITGAIKQHNDKIGNTSMGTEAVTLTGAIAEHENHIDNIQSTYLRYEALYPGANNFNTFPSRRVTWVNNASSSFQNAPAASGAFHVMTCFTVGNTHGFQIAIPYNLNSNDPIRVRVTAQGTSGWGAWKKITVTS